MLSWKCALTLTPAGVFTACIAFCIIRSEMVLFDFKEGYCADDFLLAKRFCCKSEALEHVLSDSLVTSALTGRNIGSISDEVCDSWRTWESVWHDITSRGRVASNNLAFATYLTFAVS